MNRSLFRRHPVIVAFALLSIVGWVVFGFISGSSSVPFYLAWMVVTATVVVRLDRGHHFSRGVLAGLSLWAFLHLAGGLLPVGDGVLYGQWLTPFLRYDQLTHAIGFGFAGLAVCEQVGRWWDDPPATARFTITLLGGLSMGAINETLEFLLTQAVTSTNVGGFENTGWDLVANAVGSLIAATWAARRSAL